MSYDLHVARTKDWLQASDMPITKEDVDGVVAADQELEWAVDDYVEMANDVGIVTRYRMINWNGAPCFWWYRDQIICSNPDEAQQLKLVRIARTLGAFCIGDDGERYEIKKGILGKEGVVTVDE